MASFFSRLNPVPSFPEFTGPYKVGTVDVEIPVDDLPSPTPKPENAHEIPTVLFRIFYPAVAQSKEKRITWLPSPQKQHVAAYAKFMGFAPTWADIISHLPRHLYYSIIHAHENAAIEIPESENQRWPTMLFSHGLGGCRNSYSYIAGSLASHGIVVVCPEHRDGSAVVSSARVLNRDGQCDRISFPYVKLPHELTPEVYEQREGQLRIRLWELGLIHEAMLAIDTGSLSRNLNTSTTGLDQLRGRLNIHEPGSIIFAGHSFGAATMCQLLKSAYYADHPEVAAMKKPLFKPAAGSRIREQVTEKSVTMLLDMWVLPLLATQSKPLHDLPLPVYADVPSAPGGTALLAVESNAFFKWKEHLHITAKVLSANPTDKVVTAKTFQRPSGRTMAEPNFFYVVHSAHLSQSDFSVLFPWMTKKIFNATEPERALRLNLRAQLQFFRNNGIPVARTSVSDLVDGAHLDKDDDSDVSWTADGVRDDKAIFDKSGKTHVDCWEWIDLHGMGDGEASGEDATKTAVQKVEETEPKMQGELEPSEKTGQAIRVS